MKGEFRKLTVAAAALAAMALAGTVLLRAGAGERVRL
jgi:hypothetical protein